MTNPLDFLIKDPDAMRYELMRAQTPGMKTGGRAVGGVAGEQKEVRTPPGGPMKNLTWENYRHAIGMRVGGYAEGGQVTGYGSEVPQLDSRGEVIRAQPTPEQVRYLESINNPSIADQAAGFGEAGMSFLTGIPAQLAGAVGYGVGKLTGRDPEALGAEWERSLQYQPTTPMGEVRTEQMSKVLNALDPLYGFAGHAGHAAATPNVAEMRAGLRMAGEQAVEAARPLHEAYMAGEVPGVVNPAANVVKPKGKPVIVELTEYQLAHQIAQHNAALPVEQGGLGLPSDNSAMDRAKAMGFDVDNIRYHGTDKDIYAFDPLKFGEKDPGWYGRGVTTSTDPEIASAYSDYHEPVSGQNVMPLVTRGKYMEWPESNQPFSNRKDSEIGTKDIQNLGYQGTRKTFDTDLYGETPAIQTEQVTFDPKNVRSRFAAFDPFEKESSLLHKAEGGAVRGTYIVPDAKTGYNLDAMRYELIKG